jgi:hypothetical protein
MRQAVATTETVSCPDHEGGERKVTGLFLILSIVALIYAVAQTGTVHYSLIDTFPPELKDDFSAKFALHSIALSPSTPLPLQEKYVSSLAAGTCFGLFLSLAVFSAGEVIGGCALLAAFVAGAISTLRSWRIYQENCRRRAARVDQEEL